MALDNQFIQKLLIKSLARYQFEGSAAELEQKASSLTIKVQSKLVNHENRDTLFEIVEDVTYEYITNAEDI